MRNLDLHAPLSSMARVRGRARKGTDVEYMSGADQDVGQKSAQGTFWSYSHMPPTHLPSPLVPQLLLPHARPLATAPYLKFPNTLFGNVLAVCQQGAASVGSHVEAIGC